MKTCYTISKPGMQQLVKGVFTNKKFLFEELHKMTKTNNAKISFYGVLKYENKKFNYFNVRALLSSMAVNESIGIKISTSDNVSSIYEISIHNYNQLFLNINL